jgi:hypothetical protein
VNDVAGAPEVDGVTETIEALLFVNIKSGLLGVICTGIAGGLPATPTTTELTAATSKLPHPVV